MAESPLLRCLRRTTGGKEIPNSPGKKGTHSSSPRAKRETYRGSEFASRVLADEGIPVVMKVLCHLHRLSRID